jgi:hypothetical protein
MEEGSVLRGTCSERAMCSPVTAQLHCTGGKLRRWLCGRERKDLEVITKASVTVLSQQTIYL